MYWQSPPTFLILNLSWDPIILGIIGTVTKTGKQFHVCFTLDKFRTPPSHENQCFIVHIALCSHASRLITFHSSILNKMHLVRGASRVIFMLLAMAWVHAASCRGCWRTSSLLKCHPHPCTHNVIRSVFYVHIHCIGLVCPWSYSLHGLPYLGGFSKYPDWSAITSISVQQYQLQRIRTPALLYSSFTSDRRLPYKATLSAGLIFPIWLGLRS